MPSFLTRHGSNRLRKPRKFGDEGATGRTATAGIGGGGRGGGGGAEGKGAEGRGGVGVGKKNGRDSKSSLASLITTSNSNSTNGHSSTSITKLQRSESSKRRFGLNILTRGKNRTDTGQGIVSSQIGDMRHQAAGSRPAVGPEAGSKDGIPPAASAQQQSSAPPVQLVQIPPEGLSKQSNTIPNTNNSSSRVIAPILSLPPSVSPVISSPAEFSTQQQDDSMAATTAMTSVMQRPSFPLTLSVDVLPRHIPQAHLSLPPRIPQLSEFNPSSSSLPAPLPVNDKSDSMLNAVNTSYSPLLSSPVVSNATAISFSRPALIDGSGPRLQIGSSNSLNDTIGTPLGYYITPSQTPTLLDRSDTHFNPRLVPTVVRPGPSTPPLTESSVSLSLSVTKIAVLGTPQNQLQLANTPNIPIPGDQLFNDPPTPTSSNSSQKGRDPNRHVNFPGRNHTSAGSLVSLGANVANHANIYPNPPQQNRFSNNYRLPPGRSRGNHPRPNQPPTRVHPRGRMLIRGPPRPPSPIYTPPPDMNNHIWMPFNSGQLECSVGHKLIPFRNKQHSILCAVCRSMDFEGRGEPVKRSYYCSWCAVRMCGDCKEELGLCQGRLGELWDRTAEKRDKNMAMVKDGRLREMIKNLTLGERKLTDESSGSGSAATTNSVDERGQEKTSQRMPGVNAVGFPFPGQETPPRGDPQQQLVVVQPQQSRTQQPRRPETQQPQQSRTQQPRRSETQQPQQSRALLSQPRISQMPSDGERVPRQPRQSSQGPPLPEKPSSYLPASRQATSLDLSNSKPPTRLPPQIPQLTPAETERYRLVSVPSNQKPPQSSTVVLVGEKRKDVGTIAASLKGSVTKKRNWFRSFGKKKEV